MQLPKYLIRSTDYSIFVKTDEDCYIHEDNVGKDYLFNCFSYKDLINVNFFPCEEKELPEIIEKQKLYSEYQNWISRSDGHGGCKGGTFEEFLKTK
jgi:hypothetical protein